MSGEEKTGLAAEIFLWVAVALICITGLVTVLADDIFTFGRTGPDAGASVQPR